MRSFIVLSIVVKSISISLGLISLSLSLSLYFTLMVPKSSGCGIISTNSNLLLSAVSIRAMLRSAVFIVPIMYKFDGTPNFSFSSSLLCCEYGSSTINSSSAPSLFDGSIRVMSSPKILDIFPRLISSIIRTYGMVDNMSSNTASGCVPYLYDDLELSWSNNIFLRLSLLMGMGLPSALLADLASIP